jgi:hypothetical protein
MVENIRALIPPLPFFEQNFMPNTVQGNLHNHPQRERGRWSFMTVEDTASQTEVNALKLRSCA